MNENKKRGLTRPSMATTGTPSPGPIKPKASVLLCPGTGKDENSAFGKR